MYVCSYVCFTKVQFNAKKYFFSYGLVPLPNFSFASLCIALKLLFLTKKNRSLFSHILSVLSFSLFSIAHFILCVCLHKQHIHPLFLSHFYELKIYVYSIKFPLPQQFDSFLFMFHIQSAKYSLFLYHRKDLKFLLLIEESHI